MLLESSSRERRTGAHGIGTKAKPEWLQDWVANPNHYDPGTMMPHYRF